ncbi:MAG TPA: hypothetical protein VMS65_11920 [Polyangiaceae bacterium]|nr:hypothetical protein [Polyangiaceae bacterium]
MRARLALAVAFGLVPLLGSREGAAEPLDPALERLVLKPGKNAAGTPLRPCNNSDPAVATGPYGTYDPNADLTSPAELESAGRYPACAPDNRAFKRLMSQYAFALAPTAMHSARTTGYGGFHLSIEANYTTISDADYWRKGTQGTREPITNEASIENTSPPPLLQLYSLKFRKGFGFGFEITGIVGFMPQTSIISGGADVRISLLEGFRKGVGGILPDIAAGAGVRTISGTPQFQLTVMGLDGQISKPLPIADSSVLTPWVGYQYLFIYGDSGLVDLTPGTDAVSSCNYAGNAVPPRPRAIEGDSGNPASVYDGSPVCAGGQPYDFNNNVVFDPVRLRRHRLLAGLNYRYEMVMVGGQLIMDLVPPADAQINDENRADLEGEDRQYSFVFELGAMF